MTDRWSELERLAREALALPGPWSPCGCRGESCGYCGLIAAAHPQVILDLVGEVRHYDEETCNLAAALKAAEAERDALRAELADMTQAFARERHKGLLADMTKVERDARCTVDACEEPAAFCATHADYDQSGTEERDALRAEVERLRGAVKVRARCCDLSDYGHRDGCPGAS